MSVNSVRVIKLVALAGATVLVGAGAYMAQAGLTTLALERQQAAQVQARLEAARRLLPEVDKREALSRSVKEVTAKVNETGFDPAQWGERRIRRALGAVSRVDAAQFLSELRAGGRGALFVAESFELAAVSKDAGLFNSPDAGDQGLSLGVTGTLHFKTAAVAVDRP